MMIWKPVLGLEGAYEASSAGDIRNIKTGVIRKASPTYKGYLTVQIPCPREGRHKNRTVHGVVAEAFLGPRPVGFQVNHLDGNKANNAVENLEWVTPSQNMRHAFSTGLRKASYVRRSPGSGRKSGGVYESQLGEANPNARLTDADVVQILAKLASGAKQSHLAAEYGVSKPMIHAIKSGTRWPHIPRP